MGVRGERYAPAALHLGKTRYPFTGDWITPQSFNGEVRKILPPTEFDPRTVQPIASRYTD
jgi:hypothetical protein